MANNKTFVKITNQKVYDQICELTVSNEKAHDEIKEAIEKIRVCVNDHLHEHVIKEKERKYQERKDRWVWGVIITVVGIVAGVIARII